MITKDGRVETVGDLLTLLKNTNPKDRLITNKNVHVTIMNKTYGSKEKEVFIDVE